MCRTIEARSWVYLRQRSALARCGDILTNWASECTFFQPLTHTIYVSIDSNRFDFDEKNTSISLATLNLDYSTNKEMKFRRDFNNTFCNKVV
jgi:hypothetical protein